METIEIRNELLIKREDMSQARCTMKLGSPEWRVAHVTLNWLDELLNKIYRSNPELRPEAVSSKTCCEEGEEWKG